MDDVLLLGVNNQLLGKLKKKLMDRVEKSDMSDVSRVLSMNVTPNREVGTITINQKDCTEDIVQRHEIRGCNPASTPGVGPERTLDQPKETLLNEQGKRRYQSITGATMYLVEVCRYDILYTVKQLARAMPTPSKANMEAATALLRYLDGSTDFSITYKQGGFKLKTFSDELGSKPQQRKVYIIIYHNAFQRPDRLQGGHSRINSTIYNGGEISGGGAHHEGSSLLQQHDAGARLQGRVRQRAALHRQCIGTSRRRQAHI